MIICLDTETTGLDFYHGCLPFFVSITTEDFDTHFWEWEVDPLTRQPNIPEKDKEDIRRWLKSCSKVVMHNALFDVKVLRFIGIEVDWNKVFDTTISAHLLNNLNQKALTAQAAMYLQTDLDIYENAIMEACKKARSLCRSKHKDWLIAREGVMPSIKSSSSNADSKAWKADMWLPILLSEEFGKPKWKTVLEEYANADTIATMALYFEHMKLLTSKDEAIILSEKHKLLPITDQMSKIGLTYSHSRLKEMKRKLEEEVSIQNRRLQGLARWCQFDLDLPSGGVNDSLKELAFEHVKLPVVVKTDNGNPALNKAAMTEYALTLKKNTRQSVFMDAFKIRKESITKIGYLESYEKFGLPLEDGGDTYILYPSLNPMGTKTLRWTSSSPNAQQIDKALRYVFGPGKGRVWYSLDYNNLELRIPAYLCKEPLMMELFEDENSKYGGSYHLLVFDILHPEKFAEHGMKVKDVYKGTKDDWYGYTKNGNFAEQYGAMDATCDKASHVVGMKQKLASKLPNRTKLNEDTIDYAQNNGLIHTIPDSKLGMEKGYPLHCEFQWGRVKPTVPLNFRVQGCLQGGSKVLTRGGLIPIKDLENESVEVWTGFKWAKAFGLNRGKCQLAKITLNSGLVINCDTRHKLKNENDDWVSFENLSDGDWVALPHTSDPKERVTEINMYFILGYLIGDGSYSRESTETITFFAGQKKKELLKSVFKYLNERYPNLATTYANGKPNSNKINWYVKDRKEEGKHDLYLISITNNRVTEDLIEMGIHIGDNYSTKRIPSSVWSASQDEQMSFMEGIWMSDGSRKVGLGSGMRLNMKNPGLMKEIQILSSALGYDAHFCDTRLNFRFQKNAKRSRNTRPYPKSKLPKPETKNYSKKDKYKHTTDIRNWNNDKDVVSQVIAERILYHAESDLAIYRYDQIESIQVLDQVEETYTMSVEDPLHQFVADGVVHKNTAGWILNSALIDCHEFLKSYPNHHIILTVHDEIVFDFPDDDMDLNQRLIEEVQRIMEVVGDRVGVPLTVGIDRHLNNWSENN